MPPNPLFGADKKAIRVAQESPDRPQRELGARQVELQFTAPDGMTGAVDALEFPNFFAAMVRALRLTTEYLARNSEGVGFDLIALSYNSPLQAVVEVKGQVADGDVARAAEFVEDVFGRIERGAEIPSHLPGVLIHSYHRAATLAKRSRLVAAIRARGESTHRTVIRPQVADRFDLLLSGQVEIEGTIEGQLQVLSVRGRPSIRVWPKLGPPVSGRLPRKLIPTAKAAVDEYVIVTGRLIYLPNEVHPRRIRVHEIEVIERGDTDPTFEELWGAGREHRPNVSSLQLIEEMRSGWD